MAGESLLQNLHKLEAKPLRTILLLSLILLLSGNWILPLMDRDEPRFAEASREMLQRHDWIIPTLNGDFRFDKPPLIYWCQIASYQLLGETAFAARLPSVLFTTATALLLVFWGRRIGNQRAGFYAALMFITCLQVLVHGRLSVADMPMVFFVAAATWSGWELTRPEAPQRNRWWWAFYLSLALGFLAKGPVAWLPLAGMILGRVLRSKEFRLPSLSTVVGLLLTLGLVGIWGVPALVKTHGEFFRIGIGKHVVERSVGVINGHGVGGLVGYLGAMPLYFLTFFLSFAPWAFKFPAALLRWWGSRKEDLFGCYLLMQGLLMFVVFTLVRTKLPHYTLPAFPILAFWLALRLTENPCAAQAHSVESHGARGSWNRQTGGLPHEGADLPTSGDSVKSRAGRFIGWLDRRVTVETGALTMCLFALVLTLAGFSLVAPQFMTTSLWKKVEPYASAETRVAIIGFGEDSLTWEFRRKITNMIEHIKLDQAESYLQSPPPRILILPTQQFESRLKNIPTNGVTVRVTGIDTTYLKKWDMTAILILSKEGKKQ